MNSERQNTICQGSARSIRRTRMPPLLQQTVAAAISSAPRRRAEGRDVAAVIGKEVRSDTAMS